MGGADREAVYDGHSSSTNELGRLVVAHVQVLDGVSRTVTCMVLHR